VEICGLVTDHASDIFLGHDWLLLNQVQWKFGRGEITLDGRRHRLVAKKSRATWCRRVVAEADVVIPARSQFDLSTRAVYDHPPHRSGGDGEQIWATEPIELKDGLFVAGTLLHKTVQAIYLSECLMLRRNQSLFVRGLQSVMSLRSQLVQLRGTQPQWNIPLVTQLSMRW